ncbi:MAG: hypothetical protein A2516_01885 [Alphaproteobacteria bacterium RIFOXYD12_FULL_60_8]|nr:MAG: hypothetical protein A2516_01885 [Alphaproteobacteria bacterium RIFOXYD12_FULL_60_8]
MSIVQFGAILATVSMVQEYSSWVMRVIFPETVMTVPLGGQSSTAQAGVTQSPKAATMKTAIPLCKRIP